MSSFQRAKTPQGGEPTYLAGARGQSGSTQSSRRCEQQRFDEFLKLRGRKEWKSLCTVKDLCDYEMVDDYKKYLSEEYVQTTGKSEGLHYAPSSVTIFLNMRMQAVKDRIKTLKLHEGSEKAAEWARYDLDHKSETATWVQGMRRNITLGMRKRAAEAGQKIDWAQQPVYPKHINQIAAAYDRAGGADAYERHAALVAAMARG